MQTTGFGREEGAEVFESEEEEGVKQHSLRTFQGVLVKRRFEEGATHNL